MLRFLLDFHADDLGLHFISALSYAPVADVLVGPRCNTNTQT